MYVGGWRVEAYVTVLQHVPLYMCMFIHVYRYIYVYRHIYMCRWLAGRRVNYCTAAYSYVYVYFYTRISKYTNIHIYVYIYVGGWLVDACVTVLQHVPM